MIAHHNEIDGYIYAKTLDQYGDFRLIQYTQQDATFDGVEGQTAYQFNPNYKATVFGNYVRAKLDRGGNLPRIPSAKIGARIEGQWDAVSASLEDYQVLKQNDIADFEISGNAYNMLNASVAYNGKVDDQTSYRAYLQLDNLLDKV